MFDLERFIADCRADPSAAAVRETVARTVADPAAVIARLGAPRAAGVQELYHAKDLTIVNLVWGPMMTFFPHDHLMWAVIGIYTGREDNIFWRRLPGVEGGKIEAAGAKSLGEKEVQVLGHDVIHSVTNPLSRLTGAIHVYGGDLYGARRSEWDPETLLERPFDREKDLRLFEEANAGIARR